MGLKTEVRGASYLLSLIAKLEKKSPSYSYLLHESSSRGPLTLISYTSLALGALLPLISYRTWL